MFEFHNALINGGTFTHVENRHVSTKGGGFEQLREAVASGAFHNSGDRFDPPKCHPNTRVAVLKKLMDWILRQDQRTQNALMMWLYGPAGAGKSAIAQTLAEMCHANKKLLASFFFSRNDPFRGTARALVATIAYQLCLNLPQQVHQKVVSAIEHDPLIFSRSLETQLVALVVEPVTHLAASGFFDDPNVPRLIIIDGLDECDNDEVQHNILRNIFRFLQQKELPLLFLIASRRERPILSFFDSPLVGIILARIALDSDYRSLQDIRLYLESHFESIKQIHLLAEHIPSSWPGDDVLDILVERSSGQFIYASTVMKFIGASRRRPTDQLDIILGIIPSSKEAPFADLDALYTEIFSRVEDLSMALQLIGLIILSPPPGYRFGSKPYPGDLERYLFLKPGDEQLYLDDLKSLVSIKASSGLGHISHASLKDFFFDASRSKDLYMDVAGKHAEYALFGFRHLYGDLARVQSQFRTEKVLDHIFYHTARALPTQELQENVLKFTFEFFLSLLDPISHRKGLTQWIPAYFSLLESLAWDIDQRFYKTQLKALDEFFLRHLEIYYSDPFLVLVVAIHQNLDCVPGFQPRFPKASQAIDDHGLRLNCLTFFRAPNEDFRQLLASFLRDPMRSGRYLFDATKYAEAATTALTYLSNHWSCPVPAVQSALDKNTLRKKPRRWREKWGRQSVLRIAMASMKCHYHKDVYRNLIQARPHQWSTFSNQKSFLNICDYPYDKERHTRGVFRYVLLHLPYILQHAGSSEELIVLAHQFQFGRRAKTCRKSARLGEAAIRDYLSRFSEESAWTPNKMDVDKLIHELPLKEEE